MNYLYPHSKIYKSNNRVSRKKEIIHRGTKITEMENKE